MDTKTYNHFYFAKELAELIDKYSMNVSDNISSRDLADYMRDNLEVLKEILTK